MKDIHLKDIKKDQVFFERIYGHQSKLIALEDAYVSGEIKGTEKGQMLKQWSCKAQCVATGEIIDYLTTENCEHYGPKLSISTPRPKDDETPWFKLTKIGVRVKGEDGKFNDANEHIMDGAVIGEPEIANILVVVDDEGLLFRSSRITWLDYKYDEGGIISTMNSKYKLERIK